MECPYCQQEMISGYIQSSNPLVWEKKILYGVILPTSEGGMLLSDYFTFIKSHAISSHYCKSCNVLISKLDDKE